MWALILHPSNHHNIIIRALPPSYGQASGLSTTCVDIKGDVAKIPLPCPRLLNMNPARLDDSHTIKMKQRGDTMKTMFFTQNVEQLVIDVNQLQSLHRYTENKVR
uniref:Unplaced genomic scaffold supercont1.7, whole genome shotgun sequence n=1 Tax=Cryptococcus bacillisporus CA1280 TaxID=1296109 RepID=A0A0D0UHH9_CRYGA|nr:hypothetical protein I312_02805 [Cryptococcus bacillisporus CA1280]